MRRVKAEIRYYRPLGSRRIYRARVLEVVGVTLSEKGSPPSLVETKFKVRLGNKREEIVSSHYLFKSREEALST